MYNTGLPLASACLMLGKCRRKKMWQEFYFILFFYKTRVISVECLNHAGMESSGSGGSCQIFLSLSLHFFTSSNIRWPGHGSWDFSTTDRISWRWQWQQGYGDLSEVCDGERRSCCGRQHVQIFLDVKMVVGCVVVTIFNLLKYILILCFVESVW